MKTKISLNKMKRASMLAVLMAIVAIVTVSANTDSKRAVVYISSTQTTIEENGTAADYQDGSHGLCSWTNNNIGSSNPSYRVIDPSSCWTVCQGNGYEIQRINPGRSATTNWYQSLSAFPTYHHVLCMSVNGYINRVVHANAHHFIYHDGGVYDNWTSANHTISCTTCNP